MITRRRKLWAVIIAAGGILYLLGCASDSEEELFGTVVDCTDTLSLSRDIMPIILVNCARSGCHVTGTGLPDYTSRETVIDLADLIRTRTRNGTMPPPGSGVSLTLEEINKISCWVDYGAKDN